MDRFGAELQWDADLAAACVVANIATTYLVNALVLRQEEALAKDPSNSLNLNSSPLLSWILQDYS